MVFRGFKSSTKFENVHQIQHVVGGLHQALKVEYAAAAQLHKRTCRLRKRQERIVNLTPAHLLRILRT